MPLRVSGLAGQGYLPAEAIPGASPGADHQSRPRRRVAPGSHPRGSREGEGDKIEPVSLSLQAGPEPPSLPGAGLLISPPPGLPFGASGFFLLGGPFGASCLDGGGVCQGHAGSSYEGSRGLPSWDAGEEEGEALGRAAPWCLWGAGSGTPPPCPRPLRLRSPINLRRICI